MTRDFTDVPVTLPVGDFDDEADCFVDGSVTFRPETDIYDTDIQRVVFPNGNVEHSAGLSGRWAYLCIDALCDAYERAESAERRHRSIADSVRAVVGLGGGR